MSKPKPKHGDKILNGKNVMLGYWCSYCQTPHSSHSCYHPSRGTIAKLEAENKGLREIIEKYNALCAPSID